MNQQTILFTLIHLPNQAQHCTVCAYRAIVVSQQPLATISRFSTLASGENEEKLALCATCLPSAKPYEILFPTANNEPDASSPYVLIHRDVFRRSINGLQAIVQALESSLLSNEQHEKIPSVINKIAKDLTNERDAYHLPNVFISVLGGVVQECRANMPFEQTIVDRDNLHECGGGIDGPCDPEETPVDREDHECIRADAKETERQRFTDVCLTELHGGYPL